MSNQSSKDALLQYCLHRGDSNLILGQRLSALCGHGPVLEQDIALTNIALDLVGQARNYYQYAAEIEQKGKTEDDYAYLRNEHEYLNPLLCEIDNGDWGQTILRQFLYDAYHHLLLTKLTESSDKHLADIAIKSLKEVTYHRRYSSEWVIRLGDGTDESHTRMQNALNAIWKYTGELTISAAVETNANHHKIAPLAEDLKMDYIQHVSKVLKQAKLVVPEQTFNGMFAGGKQGNHTEQMGFLLAEMQYLQRLHPGATW